MTRIKTVDQKAFYNIRVHVLASLFLVIATIAVYWQVNDYEFIGYDDEVYVVGNPHVRAGLTPESIAWSFTATYAANWHPLTWLSHMLDVHLYGMNPGRHHLINVLFHIANTLLLFFVLKRMTGNLWQSSFAAALFALHPLHVESVAQVAERKDVLSTFFWLLTMQSYAWYADSPGWHRYFITILLFILGLMAKPMLVTLPFVLLLLDYWPLRRLTTESRRPSVFNLQSSIFNLQSPILLEKIPFIFLTAALCVVTFFVQQSGGAVRSLDLISFDARIANALVSYVGYIVKMIWPHNLAFLYPHRVMTPSWQTAGACFLLVSVFLLAIRTVRSHPWFAVGWLWYIGTLVPVIGLVQVGSHSMADRYTYVPLTGIFIIIAWGVSDLLKKWLRKGSEKTMQATLTLLAAIIVSALMACTWVQTQYWSDSITLFEHAIDVTKDNAIAHTNLGAVLQEKGRPAEAVCHFAEVLRIKPDYAKGHNNMGTALEDIGKTTEAVRHYSEALRLEPGLVKTHNNLGVSLEKAGSISEAIAHYSEAIRLDPGYTDAYNNLAVALFRNGNTHEAVMRFKQALKINPDDAELHNNFGVVLHGQGKIGEAVSHFKEALRIRPDYAHAHENLNKILTSQKEMIDNAVAKTQEALELDPANPLLHFKLGNLYGNRGEFDKATDQYQKALSIQPDFPEAMNNLAIIFMIKEKYDEAISLFKQVAKTQPANTEAPYHIACIYARQNKTEESVSWLKKAVKRGYDKWDILKTDKNLDNIRESSFYKSLVRGG